MADLKITLQESITLPNGNKESLYNTTTITGVNQTLRRTDTISTNFSGSGVELLRFVDSESEQVAGSFVKQDVKYLRITNLDDADYCLIYLIDSNQESVLFKLEPKKSIIFGNVDFNATQNNDYLLEGVVDEDYYSDFVYYNLIKAKANISDVQLEYFVASA